MPLVTTDLEIHYDFSNTGCYPGTGTSVTNLGSSGSTYNATIDGTGANFSSTSGGIFDFTGTNNRITVPHNNAVTGVANTTSNRTIQMWVKLDSLKTGTAVNGLVGKLSNNFGFDGYVWYVKSDGSLAVTLNAGSESVPTSTTNAIPINQWVFLTIAFNTANTEGSVRMFRNDTQLTITPTRYTAAGWTTTETNALLIGQGYRAGTTYTDPIDGQIGAFYMYDRQLTAAEVTENFNSTKGRFLGTSVTLTDTPATASALSVLPTISRDSILAADPAEVTVVHLPEPIASTGSGASIGSEVKTADSLIVDPTITTTTSIDIQESPATASALMTEPTVIIVTPDYTEITTSIIVSAEFLTNVTISTSQNLNYTVSVPGNASAIFGDNITIITGTNASISAEQATASVVFPNPRISEFPMTASALLQNPGLSNTPNYRQLVKQLNPSLYIADPTPTFYNDGYENWGTPFKDSLVTNQFGPSPMSAVGNGNSFRFLTGGNNSTKQFGFTDANALERFKYFIFDGNDFTYEFWFNPTAPMVANDAISIFSSNRSDILIRCVPVYSNGFLTSTFTRLEFRMNGEEIVGDGFSASFEALATFVATTNSWNHFVITGKYSNVPAGQSNLALQVWFNGQQLSTSITDPGGGVKGYKVNQATTTASNLQFNAGGYTNYLINHIAFYKYTLTNSQIIQHLDFISSASPDENIYDDAREVSVEFGDHSFVVTSNAIYQPSPAIANANIVQPIIIAGVSVDISKTPAPASAQLVMPSLKLSITVVETSAVAYAEIPNPYVLSNIYYQYVQTNIAPYRYVSFDASNPYLDFGTDTDYSVAATVVGGTIVNPDEAINGKSAKTAGNSYTTDGVILKESEHDDNWGTGNASWHSSFWFERAPEDTSTGLRVLWNVNGAYDNQYAVLYHYQNKLHYQINNQVGAPIIITSPNNVNIFDFDRHFVVIESHHNNNKNHVYVYVDSVLVLDQDLDTYAITTINNPIHVGANSEANNFARLGVGCLITPFASTALPVVPTNTILYIDEVYWDKNDIDQTMINNLFNIMPDQNNNNSAADPMLADAQSVNATVSTEVVFVQTSMTANAQLVMPVVIAELNLITSASPMEASALIVPGEVFEDMEIFAEVMLATATFNDAGVIIAIPAQAMTASAVFARKIYFSDGRNSMLLDSLYSPYIRYLRSDAVNPFGRMTLKSSEVK